jgi:hypothetical protein
MRERREATESETLLDFRTTLFRSSNLQDATFIKGLS